MAGGCRGVKLEARVQRCGRHNIHFGVLWLVISLSRLLTFYDGTFSIFSKKNVA